MRRNLTIWATLSLLAALLASIVAGTTPTALAGPTAPTQAPTPYSGSGTGDLLEVIADLPPALELAHVILSPVSSSVDSEGDPRSVADAANLDAGLLDDNIPLDEILTQAHQEAPPDNAEPTVSQLIEIPADPLLTAGVSTSTAHARWAGDGECLDAGAPITLAKNETAGANVLNTGTPEAPAYLVTVVNEEGGVSATQNSIWTDVVDGQTGRALVSETQTQVDEITIFEGTPLEPLALSIAVASAPTLTATATGSTGGATVAYSEPLVTITAPDGSNLGPLEDLGTALEDGLKELLPGLGGVFDQLDPLDPAVNVELSIGSDNLIQETAADGTHASGEVWVVKLHVDALSELGEPLLNLDVNVGHMTAEATVPVGGIDCNPPMIENPLRDVHKDVTQAEVPPGGQFDYTLTIPNRGPCTLTDVVVTDTVTAPPGTTITSDPAADTTDGTTLTYNVGTLEPNETFTITLTVQVPDDAPDGFVFRDDLTAAGNCDGDPVDHTVRLDAPTVRDDFTGPCDLSQSNKSASHLEVTEGQTFNYFIHVFNQGAEDCTGVSVTDTLHDEVSFVSCEYNCTNDGQTVSWSDLTVPAGSGTTLAITVTNNASAGTTLSNTAVIGSPDDDDGPHTVSHTGPEVTDRSVLAPPKPAVRGEQKPLPRTGAELPIALGAFGLLTLGFLALRRRLSSIA